MQRLASDGFVARRGPHGTGKTSANALVILAFAVTRELLGCDWKVATTASAWRQLEEYLWPEIHKWWPRVRWERMGLEGPPLELLDMELKGTHGHAFALASNDPAKMEGAHADHLLYVFDEAKAIPEDTYEATEGAFAGADPDAGREAYGLSQSTPGITAGRFYDIHRRKPGLTFWTALHTTLEQAIAEGSVSSEWAQRMKEMWGESDPRYIRRVLGDFAPDDEGATIPLSWVEAAIERGRFWARRIEAENDLPPFTCVSADIADVGDDENVLAIRHGSVMVGIRRWGDERQADEVGDPTMRATGRIVAALRARAGYAVVDAIGVGAGVVGRTREALIEEKIKGRVVPFVASRRSHRTDASGEFGFADLRSEAWWNLRELLDPSAGHDIAFVVSGDDEERLTGDLTAPRWTEVSGGKIRVESKDNIRKRIGRSTDMGDSATMLFWEPDDRSPARVSRPGKGVVLPRR